MIKYKPCISLLGAVPVGVLLTLDTDYQHNTMATRWGIASAGKISHDFVTALGTLPSEEHVVVAVAARKLGDAQEFAKRHNISAAYGSYEELAKDNNIDVVYVGSINPQHFPLTKLMLENGKPVLCEKPLCVNLKQASELIKLAQDKKLFLMEAVWSRCFPAYEMVKKEIDAGTLGDIKQLIVNFGVQIANVDRVKYKDMGGGSILDIGIYCLQLAVLVMGTEMPRVLASGNLNEDGVDENVAAILNYEGGRTVVMSTHTKVTLPNEALIVGTKGTAKICSPFWCPLNICLPDKTCDFILPSASHTFNFGNGAGMRYEAMEVRQCLKQGLLESSKMTHAESLVLARLEDELRQQVGVVYDQDA